MKLPDIAIIVTCVAGDVETKITKNSGADLAELEAMRSKYKMLQPQQVAKKMFNKV